MNVFLMIVSGTAAGLAVLILRVNDERRQAARGSHCFLIRPRASAWRWAAPLLVLSVACFSLLALS